MRGDAAPDPDDFDVWDRAQALKQVFETAIGQNRRITAGHDHVANLAMSREIREGRVVLIEGNLLWIADFAPTRTESAVAGAHGAHEKECTVRIAMCDVRHRRIAVLVERIDHAIDDLQFLDSGHV